MVECMEKVAKTVDTVELTVEEAAESTLVAYKSAQVVDDPSLDAIISWSKSNNSFVVWDPEALQKELLPIYTIPFGRNYKEFMSQLRHYGFERIKGSAQWEFGHEHFVRGQPELLEKMWRKVEGERLAKFGAKLIAKEAEAAKAIAEIEDRLQRLGI